MVKLTWKLKLGIILIIISISIYTITFLLFHNLNEMFFHFLLEFGVIPIDLLIITLIFEDELELKKSEHRTEKLDMLMGTFYSQVGNQLMETIYKQNNMQNNICDNLNQIVNWNENDFQKNIELFLNNPPIFKTKFNSQKDLDNFLTGLKIILSKNRLFVADLINNPSLFQKEDFSDMLLNILHLDEELNRKRLITLTEEDYKHLMDNISRTYNKIIIQWIKYVNFTYKNYPYMKELIFRTNPFDKDCTIYVKE